MAQDTDINLDALNQFQWDILFVIDEAAAEGSTLHGLGIKSALEEVYNGTEVYHGRLYPSLDTLVEEEYIEKTARDDRTNVYTLTEKGERWVAARRAFVTRD